MPHTGVLAGPIVGLKYETPHFRGVTNERGEFRYQEGDRVAFLLGATPLGTVRAAPSVNLAQIVARVDGNIEKLMDPGLTNMARLVFTLDREGDLAGGTIIAPIVHELVANRTMFPPEVSFGAHGDPEELFTHDPVILGLLAELDQAGTFTRHMPRQLCSPAAARNELRRNIRGILQFRDVRIPLTNRSYVLADIFRPAEGGPVPAILNCGYYGKSFDRGTICDAADLERYEQREDLYFQGNREGLIYENHESVNTADWVPHGYAVVRIEAPGAGKTPGTIAPLGIVSAEAFRDSIEWAGEQPWSNGNVGLWGMSYHAMSQHSAAGLQPPHLKAIIAIGTDIDLYEEFVYTGGILNEEFFPFWYKFTMLPAVCGEPNALDFVRIIKEHPFKDSDPKTIFGESADLFMSPDVSKVSVRLCCLNWRHGRLRAGAV